MGNFPLVNLPETCATEPLTGHAFCKRHVHYIKELNKSLPEQKKIPTKLRDFLRFCGVLVKQGECLNVLTNFSENLAMLSASAAKKIMCHLRLSPINGRFSHINAANHVIPSVLSNCYCAVIRCEMIQGDTKWGDSM